MSTRRPRPASTTTVSSRYQTVIPSDVREEFCIKEGSRIAWVIKDKTIEVVPLSDEPWKDFRGAGRGKDYLGSLGEYRLQERTKARKGDPHGTRPGDKP